MIIYVVFAIKWVSLLCISFLNVLLPRLLGEKAHDPYLFIFSLLKVFQIGSRLYSSLPSISIFSWTNNLIVPDMPQFCLTLFGFFATNLFTKGVSWRYPLFSGRSTLVVQNSFLPGKRKFPNQTRFGNVPRSVFGKLILTL